MKVVGRVCAYSFHSERKVVCGCCLLRLQPGTHLPRMKVPNTRTAFTLMAQMIMIMIIIKKKEPVSNVVVFKSSEF